MPSNSGVERYRSPVSGSMHTMVEPGGARRATSSAAASVAPLEVPTKMPSFCASSRERRSASAPATGTISSIRPASTACSVSVEMKSGAQPCMRCGRNRGWLPAGPPAVSRACGMPLPSTCELSGSAATMRVPGRERFSSLATPFSVPPVPKPVTK